MKNTVSRDRIPPQIFNVYDRIQNYKNVKRIKDNYQIVESNDEPITKYPKDIAPLYFSTQQKKLPEVELCPEIMTLLPFNNEHVNKKVEQFNSKLLARLTMNALAASETDINAILELVETIYNSIQEMLVKVKQKQEIYNPAQAIESKQIQEPKYVIKIDLKKFIKYLEEQYIRSNSLTVPQIGSNREHTLRVPNWRQPSATDSTNKCKSFNILLQPRRMSFNISVCKFNSCSMDFFQRLGTFYNSCRMTYNAKKRKPVPSVIIRDWHFRSVSQGYLLSVLLKHNNVMSLNVMRKLYFVIITSVTPNLTIEINFKLANGIFMAYDPPPFEMSPFQVTDWTDRHRNVLESSSKILYTPAFTYNIPHGDQDVNDLQRDTKSDNTLHNRSLSDSSSTLKYESSSDYEGSDYFIRSTFYSESGFLDVKSTESSTNLTLRESVKTLTLSIDDMLSYHVLLNNRKDCGDMNFTNTLQEQNYAYSIIQQSRPWMSKVLRESSKLKTEMLMPYLNSVINETVFGGVTESMQDCCTSFTHWMRIGSRKFCKQVVTDLGTYFVRTLLTSIVYY